MKLLYVDIWDVIAQAVQNSKKSLLQSLQLQPRQEQFMQLAVREDYGEDLKYITIS
jgi:hypothetical protein